MSIFTLGMAVIVVVLTLGLTVIALLEIRMRWLTTSQRLLWLFIILTIPVLGAIAFLVTDPGTKPRSKKA